MTRLISRFAFRRSWGDSMNWGPESEGADVPEDPQEMAHWLRRMKREMGSEVTPEFDEAIDQLEAEAFAEEQGDGDDGDDDFEC